MDYLTHSMDSLLNKLMLWWTQAVGLKFHRTCDKEQSLKIKVVYTQ
jgi:hypothetical protein